MIKVVAVGRKHEPWIIEGLERYQKRLKRPWDVQWVLLPHSALQGDMARREESQRINQSISNDDYVILLDERGAVLTSPQLSRLCEQQFIHSKQIVFVIGGAYGVDDTVHRRAQQIWSLSKLVFPHQLVRLVVIEQIYRIQEISNGGSYHHE